jgi:hypothetical protein
LVTWIEPIVFYHGLTTGAWSQWLFGLLTEEVWVLRNVGWPGVCVISELVGLVSCEALVFVGQDGKKNGGKEAFFIKSLLYE